MTKRKILIVEDDVAIAEMIKDALIAEGYDVSIGQDVTALYEIEKNPPALILLDNWLNGKTGHDICYQLKTAPNTAAIPVVLVSATTNLEQTAISCMADGFIVKPFNLIDLLNTVGKMTKLALKEPGKAT